MPGFSDGNNAVSYLLLPQGIRLSRDSKREEYPSVTRVPQVGTHSGTHFVVQE